MESLTFRKVRCAERIDHDAIKVMLFKDEAQRICGWFIGPVRITASGIDMPYAPRSARLLASVATIRAIEVAETVGLPLCIVDPDDLWDCAWQT